MGDIGFLKIYKRPYNEIFNNIKVYYNYAFKFGPLYFFCMSCEIQNTSAKANITYKFNLDAIPMPVQISGNNNIIIAKVSSNDYDSFYPTYFTDIEFSKNYDTNTIKYNYAYTRYIEGGAEVPLSLRFIGIVLDTL